MAISVYITTVILVLFVCNDVITFATTLKFSGAAQGIRFVVSQCLHSHKVVP